MSNTTRVAQKNASPMQIAETAQTTAKRPQPADAVMRKLLGTWRLVGFSRNGRPHPAYGRAPTGTIRYEADGSMAVQIMPDAALREGLPESAPAEPHGIPGYIAYFGGYSVDPQAKTVAHDRNGNVALGEPRTVVRHYELLPDDRLALTLDEDPAAQVLWQRVH